MNSNFLSQIGLGFIDLGLVVLISLVLIIVLLVWSIVSTSKLCKLRKRFDKFSGGKDARSLEKEIGKMFEDNNYIKEQTDKNRRDIKDIYRTLESTFQKVGLIKYDAYSQMGGKLSFALALLDENDNGFIINSIHGTDGCYVYTKEITAGICNISLGTEEEEALKTAMQ